MPQFRKEEHDAKYILEKLIYTDKHFIVADKPDIQEEKGSIGVEHRLITTPDAMMMDKFTEKYFGSHYVMQESNQYESEERIGEWFGFLFPEEENLSKEKNDEDSKGLWKIDLLEEGVREKLDRLNEGAYKSFERNELFLTMREFIVPGFIIDLFVRRLAEIEKEYTVQFERIYIFAISDLYVIENGEIIDRIELSEQFFEQMEESSALMQS